MKKQNYPFQARARIRKILLGTDDIGDRNYTLVLDFTDQEGRDAVATYTYSQKSLYEEGQEVPIRYRALSDRDRRKSAYRRARKLFLPYIDNNQTEYAGEVAGAEGYVDPNYVTFTKNQYPGNQSVAIYIAFVVLAMIIVMIARYWTSFVF